MATAKQRIDTKSDFVTTGAATLVAGLGCSGCAFVTVIGIPLLIVTLPAALIGLLMLVASPFVKTKDAKCPKCGQVSHVLANKKSFKCKECESIFAFGKNGEPTI